MITVIYTSIDRAREVCRTKYIEVARDFAHHWVGEHPELGRTYAISGDGVGKIQASFNGQDACYRLKDLFPDRDDLGESSGH